MRIDPIEMTIASMRGAEPRAFEIGSVGGARFASRDVDGMRKQLDEMIARDGRYTMATPTNPSTFRIGRYLLTRAAGFEVQGPLVGGECEVVAIRDGDDLFSSVGSDQCDRELGLVEEAAMGVGDEFVVGLHDPGAGPYERAPVPSDSSWRRRRRATGQARHYISL